MTIPAYDDFMLPLLEFLSDSKEHGYTEVVDYFIKFFKITDEESKMEKESGGTLLYNRLGWAKTYLTKAGLLEKKSGSFLISTVGLDVLKQKPEKIDKKFLRRFDSFLVFQNIKSNNDEITKEEEKILQENSPDDLIEIGISEINQILKQELIEKLKSVDPTFFEKLILDLMEKLGYGKGKHGGRSHDRGIDGEIHQDKLGLETIYFQAKRYSAPVPAKEVRDFIGALTIKNANKGVFISTSTFSRDSIEDIRLASKKILLIDGNELVKMMIENNVGIKMKKQFSIKEMDYDYFENELDF